MYGERSTKPLVPKAMKRIGWFLIAMYAISYSTAGADIALVELPAEIPFEGVTPSGLVDLWLWGSGDPALVDNDYFGNIGASALSRSASYNDASLNGQVGLWYAKSSIVLGSDATYGRSIARALAHFTTDDSQLTLHWDFDAMTDQLDPGAPSWHAIVLDEQVGFLGWFSSAAYPDEGMETLDLVPGHIFSIYWGVDVPVWDEYGSYSQATLTLDLIDSYVVPLPGALILGTLGLSFAGWRLRKRRDM